MKLNQISTQGLFYGKGKVCESIIRALPQWFSIEEAIAQYTQEIDDLPTILACINHKCIGFLTWKQHYKYAAELYIMGVIPHYHRNGIGRTLINHAESILQQQGIEYWQVKTLAFSHPDQFYTQTREFYLAMGFRPLE
ncbi:GNAT family N-acetyltransferase [Fischerella sp. JS2]|uniref:GNAT family N-acetyltransferase n=1 Tax=Fischerella sp. JS2 TaxID=2597771 RepID=UPI0028E2FCA3|nr:GNAT family N-acetyltransferase [Fischerella sp. JS2]